MDKTQNPRLKIKPKPRNINIKNVIIYCKLRSILCHLKIENKK